MRNSQGDDGWMRHEFDKLKGAQGSGRTVVRSGSKDGKRALDGETAACWHGEPSLSLDPSGPLPGENKVGGLPFPGTWLRCLDGVVLARVAGVRT